MTGERIAIGEQDEGMRLDRWLRNRHPGLPQGRIERLLREGRIRANGAKVRAGHRLCVGDEICLPATLATDVTPRLSPVGISAAEESMLADRVLHVDDHLLVIDKPPGLAAQGGTGQSRSVDRLSRGLFGEGAEPPRLVHRLDRGTSGVMVLARTRRAASVLSRAFRERRVEKVYWAAVRGRVAPPAGVLAGEIARAPGSVDRRMQVLSSEESGRRPEARDARTWYRTVDTAGRTASWLALRPETGRTHQIRVQLATGGNTILGDRRYGSSGRKEIGSPRDLHLHARAIVVPHPESGERLEFSASLPEHMRETWNLFGWDPDANPGWDS